MSFLFVSECKNNCENILYIRESLSELFFKRGCDKITNCDGRIGIVLNVDDQNKRIALEELSDKIADVIAVGYKYKFFNENIKINGLSGVLREFLLASLISADLEEDKRYIRSKFLGKENISIDGFFNFRLKNLKEKWKEIMGYIPNYFNDIELKEFITYLLREKKGRSVVVDGDKVFDRRYNQLKRVMLLPEGDKEGEVFKEVLLSGAGEVRVKNWPSSFDEKYLKEYFGDKILFFLSENL